jgi:hypothetical protein
MERLPVLVGRKHWHLAGGLDHDEFIAALLVDDERSWNTFDGGFDLDRSLACVATNGDDFGESAPCGDLIAALEVGDTLGDGGLRHGGFALAFVKTQGPGISAGASGCVVVDDSMGALPPGSGKLDNKGQTLRNDVVGVFEESSAEGSDFILVLTVMVYDDANSRAVHVSLVITKGKAAHPVVNR